MPAIIPIYHQASNLAGVPEFQDAALPPILIEFGADSLVPTPASSR